MRTAIAVLLASAAVGCRAATDVDAASAPDTGALDAGRPDAYFPLDALGCADGALVVPQSLRTCRTAADCEITWDLLDGCGSIRAHGVCADVRAGVAAAEPACAPLVPCDDAGSSHRVTADDGEMAPTGGVAIVCEGGLCTTRVSSPANCGLWTCTPTQIC